MRVLQLGPWPPPNGGVQTNIVAIREMLLRRGHECMVINLHRHRTGREAGVYHPANARETLALLRSLQYDIIHLHIGGGLPARLLALAGVCAAMPGARSVLTFHSGGYATSPEGRAARPLSARGLVFRRFDRIIAVNQEIVRLFERFGVAPGRIRLIHPYALPTEAPTAELPERARTFFAAHSPVLVTVGLLEPEYDLGLQIDALGRIRQRHPNAGLLIAGAGSREAALKIQIAARPWRDHVLLYGDLPHEAVLRTIWDAAVFLRTTLYDGDSVAVREALHFGTPVVATDNGMRPEGVRLFPVGNLDALCGRIEQALTEPRHREIQHSAARANIEAVLDLYERLGASGRPSAIAAEPV
ncbi:MAG TPA: glycosyltransferase family 4 protein [Bryobacteraceae bacterium]|nr:glycosyltransferase family 4 protein [Bryobacteraceae bacterium]